MWGEKSTSYSSTDTHGAPCGQSVGVKMLCVHLFQTMPAGLPREKDGDCIC